MSAPEALTESDVQALLSACGRGVSGVRNRALIAVLWRGGLRCGEALALMPRDLGDGVLRVRHGKGDKARIVVAELGVNGHHPVFCAIAQGKEGKPLASVYVRRLLYRLCERAGVDDGDEVLESGARRHRVHPHALRHTHALDLAKRGDPLIDIRDQLGHHSANTTDTYLQRISPLDRIERMREQDQMSSGPATSSGP
jgi:integrase